ncbi:PilT protein domain protein [Stanieria cyanosphaera PCC 7437]|uniref:PilT protein domain protein n=1 Tax=Stanieria cyanosphaera (strain ATCC 29371 / PCC 7437) TaxID=111780 RepID=K9XUW6_STAC7|nr:type II toxin-antitoxin system VapC family toxin [Stanieria cyanosphaera]AFZ36333.1 PilT protein domain protein [Stanieria cyanosphaera PCC 7437]
MKLLLDTHCWLWWLNEPQKLTSSMQQAICDSENELFLSVASIWEIAIKVAIGKLTIPQPLSQLVTEQLPLDGINTLDIRMIHVLKIEELPLHHQDPFDRILIAQAICENLTIMTCDRKFVAYPVSLKK